MNTAPKQAQASLTPRSPYRRRRLIWGLLALLAIVFFFGAPWELPAKDLGSPVSRANIAQLAKQAWQPQEVFGLLHMVTSAEMEGRVLAHDPALALDPGTPMALSVYNRGRSGDWKAYVDALEERYPVVVFSKVRGEGRAPEPNGCTCTYLSTP